MIEDLVKIAKTKNGGFVLLLLLAIIIGSLAYKFLPEKKTDQQNPQNCSPSISNSNAQKDITINNNCSDSKTEKSQ